MTYHVPPRIPLPAVDTLIRIESAPPDANGYSSAVLPLKISHDGLQIRGNLYVQTGGRELSISNGSQHQLNVAVTGTGFRCTPENVFTKWLTRWYTVTGRFANSFWKNCPVEHAVYLAPGPGDLEFTECLFYNIAANAIQLRLATVDNTNLPPEQSPYWNTERTILLQRVVMLECGQKRGGGRAAFAFSPKSPGPGTTIICRDVFIQTVKQVDVDGKGHNSFGGMCFEECKRVEIYGGVIELDNPANGAIQFYEYNKPSEHQRHPQEIRIEGLTVEGGAHVDIRVDRTTKIDIRGCRGNGILRLWKQDPVGADKFWIWQQQPITQGYSQ